VHRTLREVLGWLIEGGGGLPCICSPRSLLSSTTSRVPQTDQLTGYAVTRGEIEGGGGGPHPSSLSSPLLLCAGLSLVVVVPGSCVPALPHPVCRLSPLVCICPPSRLHLPSSLVVVVLILVHPRRPSSSLSSVSSSVHIHPPSRLHLPSSLVVLVILIVHPCRPHRPSSLSSSSVVVCCCPSLSIILLLVVLIHCPHLSSLSSPTLSSVWYLTKTCWKNIISILKMYLVLTFVYPGSIIPAK
jgi:hypothetical protein